MARHEPTWDLFTTIGVAVLLAESIAGWKGGGKKKSALAQATLKLIIES